jgi:hypothetical protein
MLNTYLKIHVKTLKTYYDQHFLSPSFHKQAMADGTSWFHNTRAYRRPVKHDFVRSIVRQPEFAGFSSCLLDLSFKNLRLKPTKTGGGWTLGVIWSFGSLDQWFPKTHDYHLEDSREQGMYGYSEMTWSKVMWEG